MTGSITDVVIILTTVPEGDLGDTIARRLIEERVAACVNVCAPMTSFYRWRGVVEAGGRTARFMNQSMTK